MTVAGSFGAGIRCQALENKCLGRKACSNRSRLLVIVRTSELFNVVDREERISEFLTYNDSEVGVTCS